ncbi:MAG: VOC family protein [Boseongicola sp.]|nr:VOC family protein [Boseongicola sp.]MDD9977616.1 VOC family protein [Boseongicola sp.]
MPLHAFDHVNIRTANLDAMVDWYRDVLGLYAGPRPDFGFPGAWLYLQSEALIHLVGVDDAPTTGGNVALEHVAFRAKGMKEFLEKLEELGVDARIAPVPGLPIVQVNIFDPDGNHIHVDFDTAET